LVVISLAQWPHLPGLMRAWTPWAQLKVNLTTYLEVEPLLKKPDRAAVSWRPRAPRARRVLAVGELRTYYFPFRMITNGLWGATPVVWKLANESRDVTELSKKFRQLGAKRLLLNYVSVDFSSLWYGPFQWKPEALRRYVEFCKQHLVQLGRSERADYINGGFCVYQIRRQPLSSPPDEIWFAPGTEAVYGPGQHLENAQRFERAFRYYRAIVTLLPDVGSAWNRAGHVCMLLNDFATAYHYLRKFGERGMIDSMNLGEYGSAALHVGQLAVAERVLNDALPRYPPHRDAILLYQARLWVTKAAPLLDARRLKEAAPLIHRARNIMDQLSTVHNPLHESLYRQTLANVLAMQGNYALRTGNLSEAADYLLESYRTAPNYSLARARKELGERIRSELSRIRSP